MKLTKAYFIDLGERGARAFAVGFGGFLAVAYSNGKLTHLDSLDVDKKLAGAAIMAGAATLGSFVLSLVSKWKTGTASLSATVAETSVPQTSGTK